MRLLKHSGAGWKYELEQKEALLLRALVAEFPLTATAAKITRSGTDAKSAERERLLNESLAQHRQELKKLGGKLLAARLKAPATCAAAISPMLWPITASGSMPQDRQSAESAT